ncbi:hypothetical protein ACGFZJ_39195 [Streptomyces sp. NPDC048253]
MWTGAVSGLWTAWRCMEEGATALGSALDEDEDSKIRRGSGGSKGR